MNVMWIFALIVVPICLYGAYRLGENPHWIFVIFLLPIVFILNLCVPSGPGLMGFKVLLVLGLPIAMYLLGTRKRSAQKQGGDV